MAIKVSGTEVISDSRALSNIATVDATTAEAISAAGVGGGGTVDFVASGAISTGDIVSLNSDGTVSVVEGSDTSAGTPVVFETASTNDTAATYDVNAQKVVIAYEDVGNSSYGTAVVGTVSGDSISFGTPVVFESASSDNISITYDSDSQKVVIAYRDNGNSNYGTAIVGTVSGTSISFGSPAVFESANSTGMAITYDPNAQKVVITYTDYDNSLYGTAVVGTVSGTSISFGTPVVFNSAFAGDRSMTYDSNAQKVIVSYYDGGNSSYGTAIVGTVSGTSISFGSEAVFNSASTNHTSIVYDSNAQKVVIAYEDNGNSGYGTAIVGTVSGTSISFGSDVVFASTSSDEVHATYDVAAQKVVIAYQDEGNSSYGTAVVGAVSGTSISFDSSIIFENAFVDDLTITYDSNAEKTVVAYRDGANSSHGTASVISAPFSNYEDWIGIAAEDITDTNTGVVTIIGGVNESQTGLTTGTTYYVALDGTLTTTNNGYKAGRAISATKLLINSDMTGDEMNTYLGGLA